MYEKNENINKEIEIITSSQILELKSITKIKYSLEGLNSRSEQAEKQSENLRYNNWNNLVWREEIKKMKKIEDSIRSHWDIIKQTIVYLW